MNDLKKTFLAGFFVLLILLLTPYYLQLIGYQDVAVDNSEADIGITVIEESKKEVPVAVSLPASPSTPYSDMGASEKMFRVGSSLYQADVSTIGGGSFQNYILMQDGTNKYLGGYTEQGLYQDSINVSLILNQ